MTSKRVYVALAGAILAVSFAAIFIKQLELRAVPALVIAFYRMLLAVLLLLPVWFWRHRQELSRLTRADWGLLLLSGACLAIHFGTWTLSLKYIPIARSVVIVDSQPIFTIVASFFLLGERPTRWSLAGVLLAMLGIVIISLTGADVATAMNVSVAETRWGDLLALAGASSVVGYVLVGRKLRAKLSLLTYVVPVYLVCSLLLLVAAWEEGDALTAYSWGEFKYFLALAIVPTILGHTVFNWALKHVGATLVSVTFLGEPLGATLLAFLFFRQVPTTSTILGGMLILSGIYLTGLNLTRSGPGAAQASSEFKSSSGAS